MFLSPKTEEDAVNPNPTLTPEKGLQQIIKSFTQNHNNNQICKDLTKTNLTRPISSHFSKLIKYSMDGKILNRVIDGSKM